MAFERRTEPKYGHPIESIFESYEGGDTTAADLRTSYTGIFIYAWTLERFRDVGRLWEQS